MYHQVTPIVEQGFIDCTMTPQKLETHMSILKLLRYTPINLTQYEECRNGHSTLPKKPIIITFDDCYQECIDYAIPILEEKGFTAVFYMPTNYAGTNSHWLMPELGFEFPIIDWETVKRLDSSGFEVGSHSMSHPRLAEISPENCFKELDGARKILEDKLGHEVVHLAYPYGSFNDNVRAIAAETGYRTALTTEEWFCTPDNDLLLMPRFNILGYYNIIEFLLRIHLDGKAYNNLKQLLWYNYRIIRKVGRPIKRMIVKPRKQ